jgi:hypothetical protein
MDYKKSIAIALPFLLIWTACAMYSFKGSLPSFIQTIAIPLFDDNTSYPNIREDLTNKVVDAFIADNTLKIANESDADLLLNGTITSISQRAAILTSGEDVQEFQVYVNVKVKCEDVKNSKIYWEKTLSQFGSMPGSGTQDERDIAIADAVEKITEDILNNTLANW